MLLTLLACADQVQVQSDVKAQAPPALEVAPQRAPETPRYTQEELAGLQTTVTLTGELRCSAPGPFQIRVYPPGEDPDQDSRRFDSFPSSGFLSAISLEPGPFVLLVPKGPARLVLAWQDLDGDGWPSLAEPPFFADPHGQRFDVTEDRTDLVLDCSVPATEPDKDHEVVWTPQAGPRTVSTMREVQDEAGGEPRDLQSQLSSGPE